MKIKLDQRLPMRSALILGAAMISSCLSWAGPVLFSDDFNHADGLVTNEYAFSNPAEL